jgi:hypothetical protein
MAIGLEINYAPFSTILNHGIEAQFAPYLWQCLFAGLIL